MSQSQDTPNLMPSTQELPSHSPNYNLSYHQGQQPETMDPTILPSTTRKRNRVSGGNTGGSGGVTSSMTSNTVAGSSGQRVAMGGPSIQSGFGTDVAEGSMASTQQQPPVKKSRTNTPWSPAEEQRLKSMRDAQNSWAEIAKTFPTRTEGSVKKHWYKDMHYAEFAEDESAALLNAIKDYETNKWKVIGQKVGKPAKACEQYAKEHFANRM